MIEKPLEISSSQCEKSYWITGIIDQVGGGEIEVDVPDTPNNCVAVKRITARWIQYFLDNEVVGVEKTG